VRAFNVQSFHAFESDLAEVLGAARTLPLFGARRVVILRDVEKLRASEGRKDLLGEYLESPAPESVLVVTTEDEEKAKALGKRHGERWTVVAFRPPQGAALAAAVREEAARLGCSIDDAAIAALVEGTGEDRARVFNELEKLRSAVGPGGAVDVAAVERYAAGYAHHGLNDIVDAVGGRDLRGSLRLLQEVALKDEDVLLLLGMLGKRLRVLWFLAHPPLAVPKVFNVTWQIDRLRPQARRFTRAELEKGLRSLVVLDGLVKSTAVPPRLLIEHFLLGLLPGGPGPAARS
jgi:DNA polymerase-3 subunit delta